MTFTFTWIFQPNGDEIAGKLRQMLFYFEIQKRMGYAVRINESEFKKALAEEYDRCMELCTCGNREICFRVKVDREMAEIDVH